MKYFVKYIPVEGEIKEGDFLLQGKLGITQCLTDREGQQLMQSGYKKAKLFLCSRDIQVGDKFYIYGVQFPTTYGGQKLSKAIEENQVFKIIGEISKDAIWVTEEMEFGDDDLKIMKSPDTVRSKRIYEAMGDVWPYEEDHIRTPGKVVCVRIKCSQCKTYH